MAEVLANGWWRLFWVGVGEFPRDLMETAEEVDVWRMTVKNSFEGDRSIILLVLVDFRWSVDGDS